MVYFDHMKQRPSIFVICDQPRCSWSGIEREVLLTEAGPGIYAKPELVCQCSPDLEVRISRTDVAALNADIRGTLQVLEPPC
jgi:hypothetical protein